MADRMVTVKGSNVRIGDFLVTSTWEYTKGYPCGFVVDSIIDLGYGSFGTIREAYGSEGERTTIYGDDRVKVERRY